MFKPFSFNKILIVMSESADNSMQMGKDYVHMLLDRRKQDPRYLKYQGTKAIPFSFHLGFLTVSVGSAVSENITKHWLQHAMPDNVYVRVQGICYGRKKDTHIEIEQTFKFRYSEDDKIITDGEFYNTDLEFLGFYSNGSIPDEMDVCILQAPCRTLKRSIFLIKFDYSQESNNLSTTIFENVFDISSHDFEARIISMQAYGRHPNESLISEHAENSKKIFYITFHDDHFDGRYKVDISDDQRSKIKETHEFFKVRPTFEEYMHTMFQLADDEGLKYEDIFLRVDKRKDYLKIAKEFCDKAKLELRFNFTIPLNGKRNGIRCSAKCLTLINFGGRGSMIKESQINCAAIFLVNITQREGFYKAISEMEAKHGGDATSRI